MCYLVFDSSNAVLGGIIRGCGQQQVGFIIVMVRAPPILADPRLKQRAAGGVLRTGAAAGYRSRFPRRRRPPWTLVCPSPLCDVSLKTLSCCRGGRYGLAAGAVLQCLSLSIYLATVNH